MQSKQVFLKKNYWKETTILRYDNLSLMAYTLLSADCMQTFVQKQVHGVNCRLGKPYQTRKIVRWIKPWQPLSTNPNPCNETIIFVSWYPISTQIKPVLGAYTSSTMSSQTYDSHLHISYDTTDLRDIQGNKFGGNIDALGKRNQLRGLCVALSCLNCL